MKLKVKQAQAEKRAAMNTTKALDCDKSCPIMTSGVVSLSNATGWRVKLLWILWMKTFIHVTFVLILHCLKYIQSKWTELTKYSREGCCLVLSAWGNHCQLVQNRLLFLVSRPTAQDFEFLLSLVRTPRPPLPFPLTHTHTRTTTTTHTVCSQWIYML